MNRRSIVLAVLLLVGAAPLMAQAANPGGLPAAWLREPDFWIATTANLLGTGLFLSRVHAPGAEPTFGALTQLAGVPALAFAVYDLATGTADITTAGMMAYAAWAGFSAAVDHVLRIEYREPRRPGVLVPYVVLYYVGIGVASAAQLDNGTAPWLIAGATCIVTVAASFYARAMGAD